MNDLPKPLRLTHLTWPEVEAARPDVRLVLLPIGSIEQHGPNTSFDTDLAIVEDLSLRLAERFHPRVLVAPTVPYGMSAYHMGFPGTVTLRPATLLHVLEDNVTSLLHHGFTRFLLTNWHNGNEAVMNLAMQSFPTRYPLDFFAALSFYDLEDAELEKEMIKSDTWGHADELETAELEALRPDRVKRGALEAGAVGADGRSMRRRFWRREIRRSMDFLDFTANGAVGDATVTNVDDGRRMLDDIEAKSDRLLQAILDTPDVELAAGRIPRWRTAGNAS